MLAASAGATIVAADIVGYSRLMGRDEAGTVARLRRAQGRLLVSYQIVVERPGRHVAPWFAKF